MNNEIKISIDVIDDQIVQGWFINTPAPEKNQVLLYINGHYQAITKAQFKRPDVQQVHGQLHCGFSFNIERFIGLRKLELKSADKTVIFKQINQPENQELTLIETEPYSQQRHQQLQRLSIDLSKPIRGENWYPVEPTGRWGGPEPESSLMVPALSVGHYEVILQIDNYFCDLKNMKVSVNNEPVNFSKTDFSAPIVLQGRVDIKTEAPFWTVLFQYATISSPKNNAKEHRKLAIFLKTMTFNKIISQNS